MGWVVRGLEWRLRLVRVKASKKMTCYPAFTMNVERDYQINAIVTILILFPLILDSDNSARIYQDQVISDSESIIYNPSSAVHLQRNPQLSGYQIQHIPDQRQQPIQYIQTGSPHYMQYPTGPSPISSYNSYYPMYVPYQQPPNQPYPIYVMPVGPTDQSYTMPAAPTHVANSNVAYKEILVPQPTPERAAVAPQPIPSVQPVGPTATAAPTPTYEDEYDNDLAYAQIYQSQPSGPVFPAPKFETTKKAESDLLSDSAQ
ncbi:Phox/Bem1p [Artemisia annua]|uniref:Phox/Bem1p n=1 Tax=Artemisia annua TaxID=35608 RepID=A0A2U1MAR8_ARTAN|nr:Phox/Bem1p [Artemisia annua]